MGSKIGFELGLIGFVLHICLIVMRCRGQKTEGRGQKTEGRGQKTEGRGQKTEGRGQKTEGRRQKTEGRRQKTATPSTVLHSTTLMINRAGVVHWFNGISYSGFSVLMRFSL